MSMTAGHGRSRALSAEEAFRRRMQCQCERIEEYREAVLREGGPMLSRDEAALQWIERYAADFAEHYD